jgi:thiol-disulfide isomerase/thioredoxin
VPLSGLKDQKQHEKYSKQLQNLYYLKYRINDLEKLS